MESKGPGDLVFLDGNAAAASYLVISKDPLTAGTVTSLESAIDFTMPIEDPRGCMSQRTLGQEFFAELVDTDLGDGAARRSADRLDQPDHDHPDDQFFAAPPIRSWSADRGSGRRRLMSNYPSLVVATAPTPLQITCTAGPGALSRL